MPAGAGAGRPAGFCLHLSFRPPYDWPALVDFLAPRAIPGVEAVAAAGYRRTVVVDGECGLLAVTPMIDACRLVLRLDVGATRGLMRAADRVRQLFDLDADPLRIGAHLGRDRRLTALVRRRPGLRVPGSWDAFELAVRAVLGQQVTVRGATTLCGRLVQAFGEPLPAAVRTRAAALCAPADALTHLFPTAERLATVSPGALAKIGVPHARAETIRRLARAVAGRVDILSSADGLDAAVARLTRVPGVGDWTAQYIAMRALREPDAFPTGDLGLRRLIGDALGKQRAATPRVLAELAAAWSPWRAYAAMHVWAELGSRQARGRHRRRHPRTKEVR
jgi:AraC family transcriptional regulator of adaptative response / DNA-3-methyladenine glycosylase II